MQIFKTISLVLAVALTSMSGHGSLAQDFDNGVKAYKNGDFATALKEWRPLAEQGDVKAQTGLSKLYFSGEGVLQDFVEAVKWARKAAEQGHADAQSALGLMYINGTGVPQDHAKAVEWIRKAAEQGDAAAQVYLGMKYYLGQVVIQDNAYAHMWWNIVASHGLDEAKKYREMVAKKMTAADILKAQELARECVRKNYKGC